MKNAFTVGVLIGNANSPHTMNLMRGISHALEKLQASAIYFLGVRSNAFNQSELSAHLEEDYDYQFHIVYDYVGLGTVDALIISYGSVCAFLGENNKTKFLGKFQGIPYVLVEEDDETQKGDSVVFDNYNGMYELAEHLVRDHGYRRFVYLSGPPENADAAERSRAVFDVMRKYGVPFSPERVAYGDYSQNVECQIRGLMDRFPDTEAVICANDLMADTVYRECERRGLMVGRDIAVTGFDDWEGAETMNPPLTTVFQNSYDMGYVAAVHAYEIAHGRRPGTHVVPALVRYRTSCGCWMQNRAWEMQAEDMDPGKYAEYLLQNTLLSDYNEKIKEEMRSCLTCLLKEDFTSRSSRRQILNYVEELLVYGGQKYISSNMLMHMLGVYVDGLLRKETDPDKIRTLANINRDIHSAILSQAMKSASDRYTRYQEETWLIPLISRHMMSHIEDEREFFRIAMSRMADLRIKSSYIYLFDKPVLHRKGEVWECPDKMYLAACQRGMEAEAFSAEERPLLTRENGLTSNYTGEGLFNMCVFCLFAGEMQYGIFVTEIEAENFALYYQISMQIANSLKYFELSKEQRRIRQELELLIQEINEKNELLNIISENDSLTGCLNRRGFMEQAVALNSSNAGKTACLIYADLDHLKEINDRFGHMEGDYAIRYCTSALREDVGKRGIVGRIGGDEFAALVIDTSAEDAARIISRTGEINRRLNETSAKGYYVEVSMGFQRFVCGEEVSILNVLDQADKALYETKKRRRSTVCK